MRFPFGKSILQKTLERGLANGKLRQELRELGDLTIKTRSDAEAICWGLEQLDRNELQVLAEQTYALAALFQEVDGRDNPAFELLQARGIPQLIRLFDTIIKAPGEEGANTLLFILKILALYGTVEGTLKIVEAARRPLKPDGYMWSVILNSFTAGHPEKDLLYESLKEPLPEAFIGVSFLDAANAVLIGGDSMVHPFDTPEGRRKLREWLTNSDSEEFSYAHSATAALPFVSNPDRDALLDLAMGHPDAGVQMEAAWAAAKIGREDGFDRLAEHCRDFRTAQVAKHYLADMGREDVIPDEANDPGFSALAEFARWCAHPNELGRLPDELEIVDHRTLAWPPERESKPFWLIKYTLRDTTGLADDDEECGLVGSVTFCFFSYHLAQRPPEDAYAVHCYWEMEQKGLIEESDVREEPNGYSNLMKQWSGPALEHAGMRFVTEVSPELNHPERLVGLAAATLNGEPGWVVLDGARSEWYPRAEQPPDAYESVVLKIHIGRHLLGFTEKPDRKKWLTPEKPSKSPQQIVAAYENLLAAARSAEGKKKKEAFDNFGPLGKHFERYVEAMIQMGRGAGIRELIQVLAPYWDHASGFGSLGTAAFKSGHLDLAENLFEKYRGHCTNYERGEEMALLAQIWARNEKGGGAKELLIECLRRILEDSRTAKGSDIQLFEKWFQNQRTAFLRLFPEEGEQLLEMQAIPSSTLVGKSS